jgi:hypothetical protein
MLRFLSRLAGYWLVAGALVAAVVDGAKTIAAASLVTTPLSETWATLAPLLGAGEPIASLALSSPLDVALDWLLAAPTAAVLMAIGVLLLVAGRKRRPASLAGEYAT